MTMILEDVLRGWLISLNVVGQRVFVMRAPQAPADQQKTPYIVLLPVGPSPLHEMRGPLAILDRTYQFSIFDVSQSRAIAISETVRMALDGARGYYQGVNFGGVFFSAQTATYETETRLYHLIQEFRFLCTPNGLFNRNLPAVSSGVPTL